MDDHWCCTGSERGGHWAHDPGCPARYRDGSRPAYWPSIGVMIEPDPAPGSDRTAQREQARTLRQSGTSYRKIAAALGLALPGGSGQVWRWINRPARG